MSDRMDRSEGAFTVIEVIIAVLVLVAVTAGIGLATVGGTSLRGAARLQASLTSVGERAQEEIASNRGWMSSCTTPDAWCDVRATVNANPDVLDLDDVEGRATLLVARAQALDSETDGVGAADSDGVFPDFFKVEVEIEPEASVASRYRLTPAKAHRRFVTTIDRKGVEQVGSLTVELCEAVNQSDERMAIQGCGPGTSYVGMNGCPPVGAKAGCASAWGMIAGLGQDPANPSPNVAMRRVAAGSLQVVNTSTGVAKGPSSASGNGSYVFENLPAGEYRLANVPSGGSAGGERWGAKDIPSDHGSIASPKMTPSIIVEPGLKNRALVMYKPRKTNQGIELYFQRRTKANAVYGTMTHDYASIPKWKAMDSYVGGRAQQVCDAFAGGFTIYGTITCTGLKPSAQNCMQIIVDASWFTPVAMGTGTHYLGPTGQLIVADATDQDKADRVMKQASGVPWGTFCTWYAENHDNTYYSTQPVAGQTLAGAADDASYTMGPAPDFRYVEPGPAGKAVEPVARCEVSGPPLQKGSPPISSWGGSQCNPGLNTGLVPGLNTSVQRGGNTSKVEQYGGLPAALTGAGLWVRPNGAIDGFGGGKVTVTGDGECYWLNPARYGGRVQGSCNKCEAMWTPSLEIPACYLLTKTHWERPGWETVAFVDFTGVGAFGIPSNKTYDLDTDSGDISYDPPWACSGPPRVGPGSNCTPVSAGGGGGGGNSIPPSTYDSPVTGGTATSGATMLA